MLLSRFFQILCSLYVEIDLKYMLLENVARDNQLQRACILQTKGSIQLLGVS